MTCKHNLTLLPSFTLDPALLWQSTPPDAMALVELVAAMGQNQEKE